jgi:hypothetical protein
MTLSLCQRHPQFSSCFPQRHMAMYTQLRAKMLASTMAHASDWLLAPPVPGLGLALGSDCFRTAVKFRLGMPLFSEPFPCTAATSSGVVCDCQMDVYGDHALCCHNGASLLFRHTAFTTSLATRPLLVTATMGKAH